MNTSLQKLLFIFFLFLCGNLLASAAIVGIASIEGMTLAEITASMEDGIQDLPTSLIRSMLWMQTLCIFIIPSIVYAYYYRVKGFSRDLDLHRTPSFTTALISILIMASAYPLVQLSFLLNNMIPLPEWAIEMEQGASDILQGVLQMDSPLSFMATLLFIAVLPAVGEELMFRGIIQKEAAKATGNAVAGIWIAAFLFSLVHFQFAGFLPRMVLGALLGYLYLWTRSLWVPILIHFLNNGVQVAVLYFSRIDLSSIDDPESTAPEWWVYLISAIAFASLIMLLKRQPVSNGSD